MKSKINFQLRSQWEDGETTKVRMRDEAFTIFLKLYFYLYNQTQSESLFLNA